MAAARIKYINQKRSTLEGQLTNIENLVDDNQTDKAVIKLRMSRLKDQFSDYEEMHDEIVLLDTKNDYVTDFNEIQNRYYILAAKVDSLLGPPVQPHNNLNATSIGVDNNTRRIKLPTADLPKFDGDLEKWLSFKNTFLTMIDALDDITDLQKFLYLKDSLQGDALVKISIYNVSEENYKLAWKLLVDSYDKKRILIAKHLDALIALSEKTENSPKGLTRLVDDMRQHVSTLESLNVRPDEHLLTRFLERALPNEIREKWEETLGLEEAPTLQQIYKFITETAFRLLTMEKETTRLKQDHNNKRRFPGKDSGFAKNRKIEHGARTMVTTASSDCLMCKKDKHFLYLCPDFLKLSIQKRWEFVKNSKICQNCLRAHNGKCTFSHCKSCNKYHNTLLHSSSTKVAAHNSQTKPGASNELVKPDL